MYKSFTITGFRGFKELQLSDLKRVNLFAGKNNVGKTSLLEAIFLNSGCHNAELPFKINAMRGLGAYVLEPKAIWGWHFYESDMASQVRLVGTDKSDRTQTLTIRLEEGTGTVPVEVAEGDHGTGVSVSSDVIGSKVTAQDLLLEFQTWSGQRGQARATIEAQGLKFQHGARKAEREAIYHNPIARFSEGDFERFTRVDSLGRMSEAIDVLAHVDPRIHRVSLGYEARQPMIMADIGLSELVPLDLVGEGIVHVLKVVISIITAEKGGAVLIDEVENGIHHSALPGYWKGLKYLSKKAGIQVFAATHSRECIAAAYAAFEGEEPFDLGVYRLERNDKNMIDVIQYDERSLRTSFASGLEVR